MPRSFADFFLFFVRIKLFRHVPKADTCFGFGHVTLFDCDLIARKRRRKRNAYFDSFLFYETCYLNIVKNSKPSEPAATLAVNSRLKLASKSAKRFTIIFGEPDPVICNNESVNRTREFGV